MSILLTGQKQITWKKYLRRIKNGYFVNSIWPDMTEDWGVTPSPPPHLILPFNFQMILGHILYIQWRRNRFFSSSCISFKKATVRYPYAEPLRVPRRRPTPADPPRAPWNPAQNPPRRSLKSPPKIGSCLKRTMTTATTIITRSGAICSQQNVNKISVTLFSDYNWWKSAFRD